MPLAFRLASFYFVFFLYTGVLVAYFPAYLAWRGLSAGEIAWILALPQIARVFAPALWGTLADLAGAQRGIVAFACAVNAASFAMLPFFEGFGPLASLIAIAAVLSAGALPLVEAITLGALAQTPGRYGPIRLWGSLGFIAVVLAGGLWLDWQGVSTVAVAIAAFAAGSLGVSLWLPAGGARVPQPAGFALHWTAAMRAVLGAGFCMSVAHGALYAFFTLHLQRQGYSGTAIGALWTLGVLAEIGVFVALPALFRRYALSSILLASFGCAVVRFLAIAWLAGQLWILVLAQLLHAATFGAFHAASVAAVHRVFPAQAHGRGQTLFSGVAYGAGGAAGALLAGWAWEAAGPGLAFSLSALAAAAGAFLAYATKRAGF
jgi:PPP family 3-phenylpropionic acid transporter